MAPTEWPITATRTGGLGARPQRLQGAAGIGGLVGQARGQVLTARQADATLVVAQRGDAAGGQTRGQRLGDVEALPRHVRVTVERAAPTQQQRSRVRPGIVRNGQGPVEADVTRPHLDGLLEHGRLLAGRRESLALLGPGTRDIRDRFRARAEGLVRGLGPRRRWGKVAFGAGGGAAPRASVAGMLLAEELALIALDPKSGRHALGTRDNLNACLAGLLVAELHLDDRPAASILDAAQEVLDEAGPKLKSVLSAMSRGLERRLGVGTWDAVVRGLVDANIVAPAEGGLRPSHRVLDRAARDAIVGRLQLAAAVTSRSTSARRCCCR